MELVYKTIFINLFKKPLKTFRLIYKYDLYKYQYHLLVIFGVANVVTRQIYSLADIHNNLFPNLLYAIVAGGILGWIGLFLIAWLIYVSGKWLKGYSNSDDIKNIVSYSTIVAISVFVLSIISIILLRLNGYYQHHQPYDVNNINYWIIKISFMLNLLLNIYFFALMAIGVAVVQGFSIIKGLLNVVISVLLIIVPVIILVYMI